VPRVLQEAGKGASVARFFAVIEAFEQAIWKGQPDPDTRTR
jgi:hypothetical protein